MTKRVYITGVSGTGKSAIAQELEKRGFSAFSIDEMDGLCNWVDREKKQIDNNYVPNLDWLNAHDWICDIEKLKSILNVDKDLIIVTGISTNQDDYLNFFDMILLLQCNENTFMQRMEHRHKNPQGNNFGKYQVERDYAGAIYKDFENKLLKIGAISINAENPLEVVADEIISKIV